MVETRSMAGRDSKKKLSNKRRAEGFEGNVSKRIKIEEPVVQKTTNTSKKLGYKIPEDGAVFVSEVMSRLKLLCSKQDKLIEDVSSLKSYLEAKFSDIFNCLSDIQIKLDINRSKAISSQFGGKDFELTRKFDENSNEDVALDDENVKNDEIKPCDICGNVGYEKAMLTCFKCKIVRRHRYCMPRLVLQVPKFWFCEDCPSSSSPEHALLALGSNAPDTDIPSSLQHQQKDI